MRTDRPKKRRKYKTVSIAGFSIRLLPQGKWQTDNNLEGKERRRKCFDNIEEAKAHALETSKTAQANGRQIYLLKETDRTAAAKAIKELGSQATISAAVEFWKRHHPDAGAATLGEMSDAWLEQMEKDKLRPASIRDARHKIRKFTEKAGKGKPVAAVTDGDVKTYIESRDFAPLTKKGWKRVLGTFFEFCRKRKVIKNNPAREAELENEATDEKEVVFMPQQTVQKFLHKVEELHPAAVGAFAILFMAGLRPTEMLGQYGLEDPRITEAKTKAHNAKKLLADAKEHGSASAVKQAREAAEAATLEVREARAAAKRKARGEPALLGGLQWEDVKLHADAGEKPTIHVKPETSKRRRSRFVDISDNLLAWLLEYRKLSGRVAPSPRLFRRMRKEILKAAGMKNWTPDITRHTFATYHYAMHKNIDDLQAQMGHTGDADVLCNHYKNHATKAEAAKFWAIVPKDQTKEEKPSAQFKKAGA